MRRLALLLAGGALWLFIAAAPAFADGGPHDLSLNSGTSGLNGDCAACHRAHTAQAADLLKSSLPGLCLTCHNGTGATTDVVDGWQYVPDGSGDPTTTVLGALRGGGFTYALLDTDGAARLSYNSRGGITVTYNAVPTTGTLTLTWPSWTGFGGGTLAIAYNASATSVQGLADVLFGTSSAYSGSTSVAYMSGLPAGGSNMVVTKSTDGKTWTFAAHNAFRLVDLPLPTIGAGDNTTDAIATIADGISVGGAGKVGVLATTAKQATTSTHEGTGTVWGNGAQGQGNVGTTGVVLECTSCHNPHGNGQYRILATEPGEDFSATGGSPTASTTLGTALTNLTNPITVTSAANFPTSGSFAIKVDAELMLVTAGQGSTSWTVTRGTAGTTATAHLVNAAVSWVNWVAPTNDVEVVDGAALTTGQVRNYTVKPGALTADVIASATAGDYWRYKYDPSGTTNFTNFYLVPDPMNTGWNGTSPTNQAALGSASTTLTTALTASATGTTAVVASLSGLPSVTPASVPQPVFIIKIDSELMTASFKVSSGAFVPNALTIARGYYGTTIAPHSIGATVTVVSSDPTVDPTNAVLYNKLGRLTAWCTTCHTRYNGSRVSTANNGTPSLNLTSPADATFMYRHGTTSTGCEQCHVTHGTNAAMTAQFSSSYLYPDGTAEGSALLKVNNRGTCNLCHDPTGTVIANTQVGPVPGGITPGP